ncbi:MAG: YidC/Oxa1 family membrane protein insertase [Eubacteriales bacterium]|nr:YidC/Oxa1 family membrane protein insertase [Eubacteriales bacterium]
MLNSLFLLTNFVEKDPTFITEFISKILGFIIEFIFRFIYTLTTDNSLGITIILFTIIVRFLMIPLNYKQQKSMFIMQKLQPEMKKIQDKYKNKKDPEAARKMQMEITRLYSKHNCNPFSGCLPIFIQLPIFLALYFIMKNSYLFISQLGDLYTQIANSIQNTDGYIEAISPIAAHITPGNLDGKLNITVLNDLLKYVNKFSPSQWEEIKSALPSLNIDNLLAQKTSIETFLGINLTETVGLSFPKVLIALISAFTTFLSSWIMSKKSKATDPTIKMQQKVMNIFMPIMMGVITINIPCGVGLYWIVGNIVQIIQQLILTKYCENKFKDMVI